MTISNESYIRRLIKGDISLKKTFWGWFITLSLIFEILLDINFENVDFSNTNLNEFFSLLFYFFTLLYTIFIFFAIIKAANKYTGSKIWPFLSKLCVSLYLALNLFTSIDIFKYVIFEDYIVNKQISEYKKNLPIIIDSYTKLINIYKNDKKISYVYKLYKTDISTNKNSNFYRFKKQVQDSICELEHNLNLLKKGYSLKYDYLDKNGKNIITINTDINSCGKNIYDLEILKEILEKEENIAF